MRFVDIIEKKKQKKSLSKEEIKIWIQGLVEGSIPDYQSSALLMAIVLNGMTQEETTNLAEAMVLSGEQIDLSNISGGVYTVNLTCNNKTITKSIVKL